MCVYYACLWLLDICHLKFFRTLRWSVVEFFHWCQIHRQKNRKTKFLKKSFFVGLNVAFNFRQWYLRILNCYSFNELEMFPMFGFRDPGERRCQEPYSWTYNFVGISGHNLESSQNRGFLYRRGYGFLSGFLPFSSAVYSNWTVETVRGGVSWKK